MPRDRLLKKLLRQRFIVTLLDGEAFSGLLDEWDESTVILLDVSTVPGTAGQPVKVQGSLILPRDRIAYMQKPGQ